MKLVSFTGDAAQSFGLADEHGIIDLGRRLGIGSIAELFGTQRLDEARRFVGQPADVGWDGVTLLPAIPAPPHMFCIGTNYQDHLDEARAVGISRPAAASHPAIFTRFPETLTAHEQPMLIPKVSDMLDFEAELAVVIGKPGRYIEEGNALSHVGGYTCFNDGSVRDWQFHSHQIIPGKNFVSTGGFGPWIVTADEIPDPGALDIQLTVNGATLQHSNTRHLIFKIPYLISYLSSLITLLPGDVIATGTPAGVGFARKPPLFLKPGDVCEVTIENIGTLRNQVVKER